MKQELTHTMTSMLVPEEILQHFELVSIEEKTSAIYFHQLWHPGN
ncbi:MAG TPA: hypothetical protein VNJ07_00555 [Chitinophagales bacterium]|nr:hypothetical protein [Chitinophagales bacterium]